MASRRGAPGGGVGKVHVVKIAYQTLSSYCPTRDFALESLDKPLHMPSPMLNFSIDPEKVGYSGVPMNMLAVVANVRFQAMSDVSVSVVGSIVSGGKPFQVVRASRNFQGALGPQSSHCFAFPVRCPRAGILDVVATVNFMFQGSLHTIQTTDKTQVQPSLKIDWMANVRDESVLQVNIENLLSCRIADVRVRTPTVDGAGPGRAGIRILRRARSDIELGDQLEPPFRSEVRPDSAH
jgi:hypothetical protein